MTVDYGFTPGETNDQRVQRILAAEAARHHETLRRGIVSKATALFIRKAGITRLPCVCGAAGAHAHHVDYSRWWLVGFLCRSCHRQEHLGRLDARYQLFDLRELAVADRVAFP